MPIQVQPPGGDPQRGVELDDDLGRHLFIQRDAEKLELSLVTDCLPRTRLRGAEAQFE